jgi:acetylornithine deacetylase
MAHIRSRVVQDVVRILADLVAIESVNPYFPGGERGENSVADYVMDYCSESGLQVKRQPVLPGRDNVVAEIAVPGATRSLLFDCHMDTVSLDQMGAAGLVPEIRADVMTGRGSCDDKASLAAMLVAMSRLADRPDGLNANVVFLGSVDEEYLMRGAESFARSGRVIDGAIVGEPTNLEIVVAHKGFVRWKLHTVGRSAHSSNPQLGENAIYDMATLLYLMRPPMDRLLSAKGHPLVGAATWSVGKISGGTSVNIVPERCTVEIDRRLLPGETGQAALAEIDAILSDILTSHPAIHLERDEPFGDVAGVDTSPESDVVIATVKASRQVRGTAPIVGVAYGTNASKFAAVGIPSIVLGPGDIRQAHTAAEYVAIEQVVTAARLYEAAARAF